MLIRKPSDIHYPEITPKSVYLNRRLGEFFKRPTLPFNGYGDQVAYLYAGMDLRRNF